MPLPRNRARLSFSRSVPPSLVVVATLVAALGVSAEETVDEAPVVETKPPEPPDTRFVYRTTSVFRWNPLGLMNDNHVGMRKRLVKSDHLLLSDTFVGIGFMPQITGGFARLGAMAEIQPTSVMRLWVNYDVVGYYGIFGLFQSFPSASSNFSDSRISSLGQLDVGDPRRNYSTVGSQLTFGLDLQMKLGPVAARSLSRLVRGSYQMRPGDTVYYDQFYDVLAPNEGFFVTNDTDLLLVFDFGLVFGLRANATYALYDASQLGTVDVVGMSLPHNPNGPTLRAGPMITYAFWDDPGSLFNRPTLILIMNWYASHRWRTGADNPLWMPYVVLGFQMQGDLKPWN